MDRGYPGILKRGWITQKGAFLMEKTISFDLTGKVAVVTGASRGLGVELATSLAEYGATWPDGRQ